MRAIYTNCELCKGKPMQRFEECFGGEWRGERGIATVPNLTREQIAELQGLCLRTRPDAYRWADCICPRCGGEGSYVVEAMTCKIF